MTAAGHVFPSGTFWHEQTCFLLGCATWRWLNTFGSLQRWREFVRECFYKCSETKVGGLGGRAGRGGEVTWHIGHELRICVFPLLPHFLLQLHQYIQQLIDYHAVTLGRTVCLHVKLHKKGKIWGFYGGDYEECRLLGYKNPVRTSQEAHYVSATEPS
jgi:hypothetical protein